MISINGEGGNKRHQARSSSNTTTTANTASTLVRMEHVLDKLKRLNYEEYYVKLRRNKPITRHHFALRIITNNTNNGNGSSSSNNMNVQFREYVTLVSWLLSVIYGTEDHPIQKFVSSFYDYDPTTCVEAIVETFQELQKSTSSSSTSNNNDEEDRQDSLSTVVAPVGYFTVSKLKQGYGEEVVHSLDFLTAKACDKLFLRSEIPSRVQVRNNADDDNVDDYEKICIEEGKLDDCDLITTNDCPSDKNKVNAVKAFETGPKGCTRKVISSTVHPNQWKDEVERVAPQLKGAMDSFRSTATSLESEWRSQLLQTNQHQEKMRVMLPWIDTQINYVSKTASKDVESIRAKNAYMAQQFSSLCEEFRKVSGDYKSIEKKYQLTSDSVRKLKGELDKLEDIFASTTREMNEKGRSMSDMTPLLNLKAAMQNIKLEISNFNVRIGVLNHIILEYDTQKLENQGSLTQVTEDAT